MLGWEEGDKGRREARGKREERREGRKKGRKRGKGREGRRKGKREGRRRSAFCHTKPDVINQTCSILASFPGLLRLQFLMILQAIKNWRRRRPGNEATQSSVAAHTHTTV